MQKFFGLNICYPNSCGRSLRPSGKRFPKYAVFVSEFTGFVSREGRFVFNKFNTLFGQNYPNSCWLGLWSGNNDFAHAAHFLVQFFAVNARLECKQTTTNLSLSFLTWKFFLSNSTPGNWDNRAVWCMISSFTNTLFSSVHTKTINQLHQSALWKGFLKRCVFGDHFHWIHVNGRPKRRKPYWNEALNFYCPFVETVNHTTIFNSLILWTTVSRSIKV